MKSDCVETKVSVDQNGIAYFYANEVCNSHNVSIASQAQALESWGAMLKELRISPSFDFNEDEVWVPLVLLSTFLMSAGAGEHTRNKNSFASNTMLEDIASMPPEFALYWKEQYRSIIEMMPAQ
ncbi:MAG: hypothetical protein V7681_15450 [Halopseudomonas sabulinigri]